MLYGEGNRADVFFFCIEFFQLAFLVKYHTTAEVILPQTSLISNFEPLQATESCQPSI